jgi:hypothetical protein
MSNNYILLWLSVSDSLDSLLNAYKCDHGFMSFNVIEEMQELEDRKCPPSISKCYEYNHSKRKDFILWYTIIANTDKAQCIIGVKLHEHYHNGFLRPAFPNLVKRLADFGHPIQFYPSLSPHHYDGMHSIYNAEVLVIYPPSAILIFLWCLRLLTVFPSMLKERTSRFCMGMQDKTRRGKTMMISSTNLHQHPRRTAI